MNENALLKDEIACCKTANYQLKTQNPQNQTNSNINADEALKVAYYSHNKIVKVRKG